MTTGFTKEGPFPASFTFRFVFSKSKSVDDVVDRNRAADLCCRKSLLCQLSHHLKTGFQLVFSSNDSPADHLTCNELLSQSHGADSSVVSATKKTMRFLKPIRPFPREMILEQ